MTMIAPVTTPAMPSVMTKGEILRKVIPTPFDKADQRADRQRDKQSWQNSFICAIDNDIGKDGRQRHHRPRGKINPFRATDNDQCLSRRDDAQEYGQAQNIRCLRLRHIQVTAKSIGQQAG